MILNLNVKCEINKKIFIVILWLSLGLKWWIFIESDYDYYSGPKIFPENDQRYSWIPINALGIYNPNHGTNRIKYPIRLSYELTIHKSQGQTIEQNNRLTFGYE